MLQYDIAQPPHGSTANCLKYLGCVIFGLYKVPS